MIKIFLDTNILVDLIADRKPFSKQAIEIFKSTEKNKAQLYTSSHSIATTHYLLKKGLRSNHKDFEDAVQILCASSIKGINFIVTRNTKDFKTSEISILTPDEMCLKLNSL